MHVEILSCGYCVHSEFVTKKGGSLNSVEFPSTVVVIEHPREGVVLFDTGYTNAFFEQTRRFPERLYSMMTPVNVSNEQSAVSQLQRRGIQQKDVRHIVLSHFHADHIAGLGDFPFAQFHYSQEAYEPLRQMSRLRQVTKGFLSGLVPPDFLARSNAYSMAQLASSSTGCPPFPSGFDLFDDSRIMLIPLPGHTIGHLGILVRDGANSAFFIGDASWHEDNFLKNQPPKRIVLSLLGDYPSYRRTLENLRSMAEMQPHTAIVPCHCSAANSRFQWLRNEVSYPI